MHKKNQHTGQRPLLNEYDEPVPEDRPKGMPPLDVIQAECKRRGLTESDAEYIYNSWLVSGFRTAKGIKILNWRAALRNWQIAGYFPSQKKNGAKLQDFARERDAATFERIKKEQRRDQR